MPVTRSAAKPGLTLAGRDLTMLISVAQATGRTFAVTIAQQTDPVTSLTWPEPVSEGREVAVVEIHDGDSSTDVHALLERSPGVRFLFLADALPLRHAVARVIRDGGHAVVPRTEPAFVIAATAVALLATDAYDR
jgi:hypothetical protein